MTRDAKRAEEAALWVARLDQPAVDTSASATFEAWMASEPEHREDFADIQALWHSDVLTQALGHSAQTPELAAPSVEQVRRFPRLRRTVPWVAGVACAASLGVALIPVLLTTTYRTGVGDGRAIALTDGSHVQLSGDAELRVRILPWERKATLVRGEAFFDVRHESARAFVVRSGATSVRVLGTAFNVDHQSRTRTAVEVYRGAVAIEAGPADNVVLRKGGRVRVVDDHIAKQAPQPDPVARSKPDWTSGWFEAADVPMDVLVSKVQRYSARPIRLGNPSIGALPVSGRFHVSDPARVLQAIRTAYRLDVRVEPDAVVIAAPRGTENF